MPIDGWRIHRRIGMSGGLFTRAVAREVGRELSPEETEAIQARHGRIFRELLPERRPLPGAVELLADLRRRGIVHGIATSGRRPEIDASLAVLDVPDDTRRRSIAATSRARSPSPTSSSPARRRSASSRTTATSSATPSGICSPPAARGCSASASSAAATAPTSSCRPAPSASTTTPPSCTAHSTSSASTRSRLVRAGQADRGRPRRSGQSASLLIRRGVERESPTSWKTCSSEASVAWL